MLAHEREAGCVHEAQLVELLPVEVPPSLLQHREWQRKNRESGQLLDAELSAQGKLPGTAAVEEGEGLDDHGDRGEQLRAGAVRNFPVGHGARVERVLLLGQGDPGARVYEYLLARGIHGSSKAASCSLDVPRRTPRQSATLVKTGAAEHCPRVVATLKAASASRPLLRLQHHGLFTARRATNEAPALQGASTRGMPMPQISLIHEGRSSHATRSHRP